MDAFSIIPKLGGREAVLDALKRGGSKINSVHAIRMWSARRGIPGDAQTILMREAEGRGIEYTSADFAFRDASRTAHPPPEDLTERGADGDNPNPESETGTDSPKVRDGGTGGSIPEPQDAA